MALEKKTLTEEEINAMMGMTLDDLPDLPSIDPFPTGTYTAVCTNFGPKKIGEHPALVFEFKNPSVVELADETDEPPKGDAKAEYAYMLDNEIGQGKLKDVLKKLRLSMGVDDTFSPSMEEYQTALVDAEVTITVGRTWNKDKERFYGDVKAVSLN